MNVTPSAMGLTIDLDSQRDTRDARTCSRRGLRKRLRHRPDWGLVTAGKTRLVRAVAESLGVDPHAIASPTFVLIHEYEGRIPVYHFDVYRLGSLQEFEDLGVADYWNAGGVCLIEWADRVQELLPAKAWQIRIEPTGQTRRQVQIDFPAAAKTVASRLANLLSPAIVAHQLDDAGPVT